MLGEKGMVVLVMLLLISMVAVLLLLMMMLVLLRDFHLDFSNRRMNSIPLRMALIFVTSFFRGEGERKKEWFD